METKPLSEGDIKYLRRQYINRDIGSFFFCLIAMFGTAWMTFSFKHYLETHRAIVFSGNIYRDLVIVISVDLLFLFYVINKYKKLGAKLKAETKLIVEDEVIKTYPVSYTETNQGTNQNSTWYFVRLKNNNEQKIGKEDYLRIKDSKFVYLEFLTRYPHTLVNIYPQETQQDQRSQN